MLHLRVFISGNHETGPGPVFKYSEYINRIADAQWPLAYASGSTSNRWFAFSVGQVAFVVFDTGALGASLYLLHVDHQNVPPPSDAWIYPSVYPLAKPQVGRSRERSICCLPACSSLTNVLADL